MRSIVVDDYHSPSNLAAARSLSPPPTRSTRQPSPSNVAAARSLSSRPTRSTRQPSPAKVFSPPSRSSSVLSLDIEQQTSLNLRREDDPLEPLRVLPPAVFLHVHAGDARLRFRTEILGGFRSVPSTTLKGTSLISILCCPQLNDESSS